MAAPKKREFLYPFILLSFLLIFLLAVPSPAPAQGGALLKAQPPVEFRVPCRISFEEDARGVIETGKLADLAVLDQPYLTMPPDKIHTLQSVLTLVGGKAVHASDDFRALKDR